MTSVRGNVDQAAVSMCGVDLPRFLVRARDVAKAPIADTDADSGRSVTTECNPPRPPRRNAGHRRAGRATVERLPPPHPDAVVVGVEPPDVPSVRLDLAEFHAVPAAGDDPPLTGRQISHAGLRSASHQPSLHSTPRCRREARRGRDRPDDVARHDATPGSPSRHLDPLGHGEDGVALVAFYSNGPDGQQEYVP